MSLMAGLVFGGLSAYGALNVSNDPSDIKISLCEYTSVCSIGPTGCKNPIMPFLAFVCSGLWTLVDRDGNEI